MEIPKSVRFLCDRWQIRRKGQTLRCIERLGSHHLAAGYFIAIAAVPLARVWIAGAYSAAYERQIPKNSGILIILKGFLDIIEVWWLAGGENKECLKQPIFWKMKIGAVNTDPRIWRQ